MKIARKISGAGIALAFSVAGITGVNAVAGDIPTAEAASCTVIVNPTKTKPNYRTGGLYNASCGSARFYHVVSGGKRIYAPAVGFFRTSTFNVCHVGVTGSGGQILRYR